MSGPRPCLAWSMYRCPICGYPDLAEPAWDNGTGSDEICPCCGTHLGYDDAAGGDAAERERTWVSLRQSWLVNGCPWFSQKRRPPAGWSASAQMSTFG